MAVSVPSPATIVKSLTDEQQDACIAAGAKVQSRPRLGQSGPLTGQQYWVRRDYARQNAQSKATKLKIATQMPQPQRVARSTWGTHRGISVVSPEQRRLKARPARKVRGGRQCVEPRVKRVEPSSKVLQNQRVTGTRQGQCRRTPGVTPSRVERPSGGSTMLRGLGARRGSRGIRASHRKVLGRRQHGLAWQRRRQPEQVGISRGTKACQPMIM